MVTEEDTGRSGARIAGRRARVGASTPSRKARPRHGLGPIHRAWVRFRRNRLSLAALLVFWLVLLFSFGAPLIALLKVNQALVLVG
jgi:hypothetical protein